MGSCLIVVEDMLFVPGSAVLNVKRSSYLAVTFIHDGLDLNLFASHGGNVVCACECVCVCVYVCWSGWRVDVSLVLFPASSALLLRVKNKGRVFLLLLLLLLSQIVLWSGRTRGANE